MDDAYVKKIISFKGYDGGKWLQSIPQTLSDYEKKWSVKALPPFSLSYNYVAPVVFSDGTPAVIKIGFPGDREFQEGISALQFYNGRGAGKVLQADLERNIVLLEQIIPGKSLLTVEDDEHRTIVAATVMKLLWRKAPKRHNFSSISDWGKAFGRLKANNNGTSGPLPKELFDRAESIFFEYIRTQEEVVVLHGDLHYENILSSYRESWLAIDPKGIIGERVYDTAAILRNPKGLLNYPNAKSILQKRIDILASELRLKKERIKGWAFAQAILSAIWTIEDHGEGFEKDIQFAQYLSELI